VAERLLATARRREAAGATHCRARRLNGRARVPLSGRLASLYGALGWARMQLGQWEEGAAAYEAALEGSGEADADLRINHAVCLMRTGRLVQAQVHTRSLAAPHTPLEGSRQYVGLQQSDSR